ncbi:MBL fold metallo-hydrolase [Thalassobacillus hwangdonensis]|uniref:MBL fold metallo-hydrolase n=1 Tax=Thalassobacillus hwangdonensis TaxID=546108 RepID=A0ABW3L0Q3_9BACI
MKIRETEYFSMHELDEGVYAAIAKPGKGAWSNAGVVDLGDSLLVFDAFSTPTAALELRKQAESLTGKKVQYMINSHYHGDHVFGNQAFADATIISTPRTKQLIEENNTVGDLEKEKTEMEAYLQSLKVQIEESRTPVLQSSLESQYNEMKRVLDDLHVLRTVLPQVLFEEKLVIEGSKRKVELHCLGGGHTPSDTFMYLPDEKIAFMGDLVTENLHVPVHDPQQFHDILEYVKKMDIDTLVPGHGNVGNLEMLHTLAAYLDFLIRTSQDAIRTEVSLESLLAEVEVPTEYRQWQGIKGIKGNLSATYAFYMEETKKEIIENY